MLIVGQTLARLKTSGKSLLQPVDCALQAPGTSPLPQDLEEALRSEVSKTSYSYSSQSKLLTFPAEFDIISRNRDKTTKVATWNMEDGLTRQTGYSPVQLKRFFRIGTVARTPWTYVKTDEEGAVIKDELGQPVLQGYCLEMIEKMAEEEMMMFDYEVTLPSDGSNDFGKKNVDTGEWNGLIGDLIAGDIWGLRQLQCRRVRDV